MATVIAPGSFSSYTGETNKTGSSSQLGKDEFLKLLITQLKYQNPLEPMEDKDFIAQMASFSSLEQMQNLNTAISSLVSSNQLQQAASLIGKEVSYMATTDEGNVALVTGTVGAVTRQDNTVYLSVDGVMLTLDEISIIK